jgi:hypothetical protein
MADSALGRIVLTFLLAALGAGFTWMGAWGLRGRDTHLPAAGAWDGHPALDEGDPPLRGAGARWVGALYLLVGLAALGGILAVWR